jgi:hypothetical protein
MNLIQAPVVVGTYELLKSQKHSMGSFGIFDLVPLPYLAGACSSIILHPLDTIRKIAMVSGYGIASKETKLKTYSLLKEQVFRQGIFGLYAGFTFTLLRNTIWLSLIYSRQTETYKQLEAF